MSRHGLSRWTLSSAAKVRLCPPHTTTTDPHPPNAPNPQTSPAGQIAFREFLKSEFSEENILFWLACEEYKKIKTVPEMISSANRIYSEFVQTEAPKQVKEGGGDPNPDGARISPLFHSRST